jgi:hypothetical protein
MNDSPEIAWLIWEELDKLGLVTGISSYGPTGPCGEFIAHKRYGKRKAHLSFDDNGCMITWGIFSPNSREEVFEYGKPKEIPDELLRRVKEFLNP